MILRSRQTRLQPIHLLSNFLLPIHLHPTQSTPPLVGDSSPTVTIPPPETTDVVQPLDPWSAWRARLAIQGV